MKEFNVSSFKKGGSKTPASVMGSQGKPAPIVPQHNKSKSTKMTKFPK